MEDVRLPVRLINTLVGKAKDFNTKSLPQEWSNADTLEFVKDKVATTLRDTATYVVDETRLITGSYPDYYAAGWFVSGQLPVTELVVVAHGSSMASAQAALMEAMSHVPWSSVSAEV